MLIGVLGAGQLGQMLGQAGISLGARFRFFDPVPGGPASAVGECVNAPWNDFEALARFCEGLDVCTFEFENVPAETLEFCAARVKTHPNVKSLTTGQDRASEKAIFAKIGFDVPPYAIIDTEADLLRAIGSDELPVTSDSDGPFQVVDSNPPIGVPSVLKARRGGYDGKGQAVIRSRNDALSAWDSIGRCPAILETFVSFTRELSIIGCRSKSGAIVTYPLVENTHTDGILTLSIAPAPNSSEHREIANIRIQSLLVQLDYCGTLAIEMFEVQTPQGPQLIPNEFAPRVHNSGHWTIEGTSASQFENHIRAIMGLSLRSPVMRGFVAMMNLIGTMPDLNGVGPNAQSTQGPFGAGHLHIYGKQPRPGRKLGHETWVERTTEDLELRLKVRRILSDP